MPRKLTTIILIIALILSILFGVLLVKTSLEKRTLTNQNSMLQNTVDAIGPTATAWTVKSDVGPGDAIKASNLVEMTIPASGIDVDNLITSTSNLKGCFYKIKMRPGTYLTKDLIMKDKADGTEYERDVMLGFLPIGLKVGDYIDMRVVLPYGEEFTVLPHERVEYIIDNTIKIKLTESELALYSSALTDLSIHGNNGLKIYVTKYLEPGVQDAAKPMYPVRKEAESSVNMNPNIKDKARCVNSQVRAMIDAKLASVDSTVGGRVAAGVTSEKAELNKSHQAYVQGVTQGNFVEVKTPDSGDSSKSSGTKDTVDKAVDKVEESVDNAGNASSVTSKEKENAAGDKVFDGESAIE